MRLKLINGVVTVEKNGVIKKLAEIKRGEELNKFFTDSDINEVIEGKTEGRRVIELRYRWGISHQTCDDCAFIDTKEGLFAIFDGVTNVEGKEPGYGGRDAADLVRNIDLLMGYLKRFDFKTAIEAFSLKIGKKKTTAVILQIKRDAERKLNHFHIFSVGDSKIFISEFENDDTLVRDKNGRVLLFGNLEAYRFYEKKVEITTRPFSISMFTDGYLNPEDDLIEITVNTNWL